MNYQPFLIAPFKTGLDSDQEPWLLPADAFENIDNGHIHHGYIEKRSGYRFLANIVHGLEISAATNADPAVFTVSSTSAMTTGDTVSLWYLAGGTWSNLNATEYTITVINGTTFSLTDSSGTAVDGTSLGTYTANSGRVGYYPGNRVMGIFRFIGSDNTREMLAVDTERACLYNATSNLFQPLDLTEPTLTTEYPDNNHFASSATDYLWAANWQHSGATNRVYFTNGKAYTGATPGTDGILYYDGATTVGTSTQSVIQFQPQISSTGPLVLYGCKLIFSIRQRLLTLHTFENDGSSTNTFPQRARWCAAQDPSNWDQDSAGGGGYVDAPTGEQIISARQVQDVIIVHFTDSIWTLRPVSDPALPFRWDKINSFLSCDGKMASAVYDRYCVSVGNRGIVASDGVEARRIDERIEDFTSDEINSLQFDKVFMERQHTVRRTWALYPTAASDDADKALIFDEESGAYSTYTIAMNVLGYGSLNQDLDAADFVAANDLDKAAEDFDDETAFSFSWTSGTELFLGGDRSGQVHVLDSGTTDDGANIEFSCTGASWNPYKEEGVEAQIGYLDLYLDSDQKTRFQVDFFKDDDPTPYQDEYVDALPDLKYVTDISDVVINSDPSTGFVVTANSHGLSEGDEVYFYGITGAGWLNDYEWTVGATITENTFSVDTDITGFGKAITAATQANPCVVTSASHELADGDLIEIVDVTGMTELNGNDYELTSTTTNTFALLGIDSSGFTAYSSGGYAFLRYLAGGQIVKNKFYRTKCWKRAYAGAIGYQHKVRITESSSENPFRIQGFRPWFKKRGRRTLG